VVVPVLGGTVADVEGHDLEQLARDRLRAGPVVDDERCQYRKNRKQARAARVVGIAADNLTR
jgi:hypothetical protein